MSTPCTITGTLRDPSGDPVANADVRIIPARSIGVSDDGIILPVAEDVQSDGSGDVSFAMLPGVYRMTWLRAGRVPMATTLTVPDAATADLQDCIPEAH